LNERKIKIPKECYTPDEALSKLMNRLHGIEDDEIELDKKERAKEITKQEADRKREKLQKRKKDLGPRKNEVLNGIIFPSFANITVLLEHVLESPYIRRLFANDLKELFLTKSDKHKKWPKNAPIFTRFIGAATMMTILGTNKDEVEDNIPLPDLDSRLILCDIMQQAIYQAMQDIGPHKFHYPNFQNKTLMIDIDRALAWTHEVSYEADKHLRFQKAKRPPQF
jgi:hypothetical protein